MWKGKRKYEKQNNEYWKSGIVEARKKRTHSRDGASVSEPESEASVVNSAKVSTTDYEKKTVKQLVEEIKSRNLQVNVKSKLKKEQLIDVLKNSDWLLWIIKIRWNSCNSISDNFRIGFSINDHKQQYKFWYITNN